MRYMLSISELAKLNNITSETLRYYDRIGLIRPDMVSKGGRRLYSIRQYERLGTILELRAVGMSIKEIEKYFQNRNVQKSIELLEQYQKKFEKKINEEIALNESMKRKIAFLQTLESLPEPEIVFEEEFPVRYALSFGVEAGDREEHAMAFTKLQGYINEKIPIIASDRVGVFADEKILIPSKELIPAVPMILVSPQYADEKYLKEIPAGKYVCMYYKNGTLEKYDESFEKIKRYLVEERYQICGKILQLYKIDVTLTDNREETLLEIQIPVR